MQLKNVYLIFTVLGTVIPLAFFATFAAQQGLDLLAFISARFVNGAAGGFSADLLISSFVFWIYMFSKQATGPGPALFIVLNLCIGLSCALPAYLWAVQRKSAD
jgi:hypothetical protein